jgi:hypothetical protein
MAAVLVELMLRQDDWLKLRALAALLYGGGIFNSYIELSASFLQDFYFRSQLPISDFSTAIFSFWFPLSNFLFTNTHWQTNGLLGNFNSYYTRGLSNRYSSSSQGQF